MVVCPLFLWGIHAGQGRWWGYLFHTVYFGVIAMGLWEALSVKDYENIRQKDPSLNKASWVLNWVLFFVVLPLAGWLFFGLPDWLHPR